MQNFKHRNVLNVNNYNIVILSFYISMFYNNVIFACIINYNINCTYDNHNNIGIGVVNGMWYYYLETAIIISNKNIIIKTIFTKYNTIALI